MFAAVTDWDDGLDDDQLAAADHGDTPLIVIAGAGTGKTRTLTARVARLLERGIPPERVLLLCFTRRASDDMLARAAALIGRPELARRLKGGTFHHVAYEVIRSCSQALGLPTSFSVLDPGDAADVMDLLRDDLGLSGTATRLPKPATLVDLYSRCINTNRTVAEVIDLDFPWCKPHLDQIIELCRAYVARKRACFQLDYDDLLLYWRAGLSDGVLGPELSGLWDYVLVDEYQDVNSLQVDIVEGLCRNGRGLTVVGDDAQAVYGFRGADAGHLARVKASHPDATIIRLERNFRSLQPILDVANHIRPASNPDLPSIQLRADRHGRIQPTFDRCYDASSEARAVVNRILERHEKGLRFSDQAVLVRAAYHSDLIELELSARRVPYRKYGGLKFLETAHIKDFVAAVRLASNPADDIAWFRLLRLHEGIGPARARQLLELLPPRQQLAIEDWTAVAAAAPPRARNALNETMTNLAIARDESSPLERATRIVSLLRPLITTHYSESAPRLEDLERLAAVASTSEDLDRWATAITLDPPASTGDLAGEPELDEDYVVISTVHSAKGLEWRAVHLVHLIDGAFPSDMALRSPAGLLEERRLFYVGVTRACDELHLYSPHRMPHHRHADNDRHTLVQASRFIDGDLLKLCALNDEATARVVESSRASAPIGSSLSDSIRKAVDLDSLWK